MGVRNLTALLKRFAPSSLTLHPPHHYHHRILAIDAHIFLHRALYASYFHPHPHLQFFLQATRTLRRYNIVPLFIFDGSERPAAKAREVRRRKSLKQRAELELAASEKRLKRLEKVKQGLLKLKDKDKNVIQQVGNSCWESAKDMNAGVKMIPPAPTIAIRDEGISVEVVEEVTKVEKQVEVIEEVAKAEGVVEIEKAAEKEEEVKEAKKDEAAREEKGVEFTVIQTLKESMQEAKTTETELKEIEAITRIKPSKHDVEKDEDEAEEGFTQLILQGERYNQELENRFYQHLVNRLTSGQIDRAYETFRYVYTSSHNSCVTLSARAKKVTDDHVARCKELLEYLGMPVFISNKVEADSLCATLSQMGIANGTVSEDLDVVAFGDGLMLRHVFSGDPKTRHSSILQVDPLKAREALKLNRAQFVDLCILCGTDFSSTLPGIGPIRGLRLIQELGSIEAILEKRSDIVLKDDWNPQQAREQFLRKPVDVLDMAGLGAVELQELLQIKPEDKEEFKKFSEEWLLEDQTEEAEGPSGVYYEQMITKGDGEEGMGPNPF